MAPSLKQKCKLSCLSSRSRKNQVGHVDPEPLHSGLGAGTAQRGVAQLGRTQTPVPQGRVMQALAPGLSVALSLLVSLWGHSTWNSDHVAKADFSLIKSRSSWIRRLETKLITNDFLGPGWF